MSFTEKVKDAENKSKGRELFTMPFGKYRGVLLKEIPDNYLKYAMDTFNLDTVAYYYIKEELINREIDPKKKVRDYSSYKEYVREATRGINKISTGDDLEIMLDSLFRKLSMKYHPDRGGSDKEMAVVNNLKEEFLGLLKNEGIIE